MAERYDLPLIQLRGGDWIDPWHVRAIVAGRNARPFTVGSETFAGYVRVETPSGYIMCPCRDWHGALKYRDTLAVLINERRAKRKVPVEQKTNINGREIDYVSRVPDEEMGANGHAGRK